jgi:hypothetical protein
MAAGISSDAQAHMTVQGMNHFTTGALHPLMTPAHVLVLLGLGLCVGQHPPLKLKLPLGVFAVASALALALTATGWVAGVHQAILAGIALSAGAVVSIGKAIPLWARAVFCAAGALAIGLDSAVDNATGLAAASTLLGTWLALILCVLNGAHYVSLAAEKNKQWVNIGIRVAGSWIVAISLLVIAFALRRKGI